MSNPRDAYHLFASSARKSVKDEHPELNGWEITSKLGATWRNMDENDKAFYTGLQSSRERVDELRRRRDALDQLIANRPATARQSVPSH
jgi:hypothetical protein